MQQGSISSTASATFTATVTTGLRLLHGRALHRAVAAKHAAIARQRTNPCMTALARVKEKTRVRGHIKLNRVATRRTGQCRAQLNLNWVGPEMAHDVLTSGTPGCHAPVGGECGATSWSSMYSRTNSRARCNRLLTAPCGSFRRCAISAIVNSSKSRSNTTSR